MMTWETDILDTVIPDISSPHMRGDYAPLYNYSDCICLNLQTDFSILVFNLQQTSYKIWGMALFLELQNDNSLKLASVMLEFSLPGIKIE